jgi:hypothetical protein
MWMLFLGLSYRQDYSDPIIMTSSKGERLEAPRLQHSEQNIDKTIGKAPKNLEKNWKKIDHEGI